MKTFGDLKVKQRFVLPKDVEDFTPDAESIPSFIKIEVHNRATGETEHRVRILATGQAVHMEPNTEVILLL